VFVPDKLGTDYEPEVTAMAPEETKNTKSTKKTEATDEKSVIQDQVLDAIKRSQEATLKIVGAWSESVAKLATNLPDVPKLPLVDSLPKPGELSDQFFDFAQKLMTSQQEFVQKLIKTLPGHGSASD
jgi:3-methyladenine DNA glycosylase AlkC